MGKAKNILTSRTAKRKLGIVKRMVFTLVAVTIFFALAETGSRALLTAHFRHKYTQIFKDYNVPLEDGWGERLDFHPMYFWLWKGGTRFRRGVVPKEKPEGMVRIITLGDSTCWGVLVDREKTYSALLEKRLQEQFGADKVQVLNGGVLGYSSLQILRYLQYDLAAFSPDIVIIKAAWDDSPPGTDPYIVEQEVDDPGLSEMLFRSAAYYLLKYAVISVRNRIEAADKPQRVISNHDLLADLAEERGYDLIFVEYPVKVGEGLAAHIDVDPANRRRIWPAPFVPLLEPFLESGLTPDQFLFDHVHLSEAGHKVVADAIYGEVAKKVENRLKPTK